MNFFWYQLILYRLNFILNQSDKKSDEPGILGLYDPLIETIKNGYLNPIQLYFKFENDKTRHFHEKIDEKSWVTIKNEDKIENYP